MRSSVLLDIKNQNILGIRRNEKHDQLQSTIQRGFSQTGGLYGKKIRAVRDDICWFADSSKIVKAVARSRNVLVESKGGRFR